MSEGEFAGIRVAVLDAGAGVGPGIVTAFQARGARVAVGESREGLANLIGTDLLRVALEDADQRDPMRFFDSVEQAWSGIDVFIAAARPVQLGKALDVAPDAMREIIEADLVRPALYMQEAARRMAPHGYGRIIALASMSGKTGVHTNVAPFAAAKGGLVTFARVMAAELAGSGITVNVIATALFEPQVVDMDEAHKKQLTANIPVGRFGRPREAGHAALYLASRDGGFVTGETLNLSGGRFMD